MAQDYIEYRFITGEGTEHYEMVDSNSIGHDVTVFSKMHKAVKAIPVAWEHEIKG